MRKQLVEVHGARITSVQKAKHENDKELEKIKDKLHEVFFIDSLMIVMVGGVIVGELIEGGVMVGEVIAGGVMVGGVMGGGVIVGGVMVGGDSR